MGIPKIWNYVNMEIPEILKIYIFTVRHVCMCVDAHICMYICMHTYIHTYIYIYTHSCMCLPIYIYIYIYIHVTLQSYQLQEMHPSIHNYATEYLVCILWVQCLNLFGIFMYGMHKVHRYA